MIEADIIKIKKKGRIKYPITKPEAVIDENGKNILQLIQVGSGYDDTKIKEDITSLQQSKADKSELAELSERIDNLPTAESSVFEAVYGETTYDEIIAEYNANKHVIVKFGEEFLSLARITKNRIDFTSIVNNNSIRVSCGSDNVWNPYGYTLEWTRDKVKTINEASTDTQYPSAKAVYDALKNLPQGGSSATPDWNAREGEDGYIKNKPFYNNVDYVINKGGEYKNVHNESDVTFNNKILFNLRDIVDNDVITINDGPPVTLEKRYESDGTITLIIEDVSNYLSTYPIIIGNLVTIPEIFIPDTIARKSDIVVDPIVWKYLCNPLIIEEGTEVPDELYDEDSDWLKYEYPAMYRFYDGMEFKFCAKADYNRLTDSKNQDWYINMQTFYLE